MRVSPPASPGHSPNQTFHLRPRVLSTDPSNSESRQLDHRWPFKTSCESATSGNRQRCPIIRSSSANRFHWLPRAYSVRTPEFTTPERARRKARMAKLCPIGGTRKSALCVRLKMHLGSAFAPHSTYLRRSSCERTVASSHRSSPG